MTAKSDIGPRFDSTERQLGGAVWESCVAQLVPGPRAAEALLLEVLVEACAEAKRDPFLLSRPVRVVVPSRSLREHLSSVLVSRVGRAVAGIEIQTAHRLACDVLSRAGELLPAGDELVPLVVSRLARDEPELRRCLDDLAGGYRVVESVVHDLLDAGFEPVHAEFVAEQLDELAYGSAFGRRARAAVNVAAALAEGVEKGGLGHRSGLFRSAREVLDRDPLRALPSRALWIYGFADATGTLSDFLEALVRRCDARVVLDRPRDPADPARDDAGVAFTLRFAERLSAIGELSRFESAPPPSRVRILRAPGPTAELHAVASRIRALLDAGAIPERIGVVARDLARLRLPLRRHFAHLAIPHSGHGETGALTPVARRVEALLVLMRRGGAAPAELFVDVVERIEVATDTDAATDSGPRDLSHTERADLAWALHAAGVARLDGLAALGGSPPPARDLPLDVRTGLSLRPDGSTASERRRVSRQLFGAIAKRAAAFVERWSQGAVRASLAEYGEALVDLASVELGWTPGAAGVTAPGSAGDLLAQGVRFDAASAAVEVDREEFLLLLERRLVGAGREALGGRGGGVQVLSVMEARSRTFDHLFVIGLEAGSFPRSIQEGPILPDALRRNLRSVLPDLPVKAEGHDEERFLFAQLVEASPDVVLSVSVCDDDGKPRSVSPFVERLQASDRAVESVTLPTLWSRRGLATGAAANPDESRLRPAHELLQLTGLYGSRVQFGEALTAALAGSPGGAALANARLAVLSELDPGYALRSELGPYFGFVGGAREPADPRRADLYVTTVESLCGCPWRTFLERLLHVAPAPDALATLPDLDALVIGAATHRVLEEIVFAHLGERGEPLDSALARTPAAIPWPDGPTLRSLVQKQAERALSEAGIAWPALAAALAERMAAFLDSARRIAWPGPAAEIGVLGVEVTGRVEVARAAGEPRSVYFRADRVDRTQDGALLLWDYKTGKPVAVQQSEQRRRTALLKKVQRGDFLQGAAYALGARALAGGAAEGRYLYLSPDAPPQAQVARVPADDEEFQAGFERAASRAVAALDAGSFFPRLVVASGEKEFPLCDRCDVRDACARGDSGARRRLVSWHAARSQAFRLAQEAEPTPDAVSGAARAEAAALAIWQLHEAER